MRDYYDQREDVYDRVCVIKKSGSEEGVEAEVIRFEPKDFLLVSIDREVRIHLAWDSFCKEYLGEKYRMEFTSKGPEKLK